MDLKTGILISLVGLARLHTQKLLLNIKTII